MKFSYCNALDLQGTWALRPNKTGWRFSFTCIFEDVQHCFNSRQCLGKSNHDYLRVFELGGNVLRRLALFRLLIIEFWFNWYVAWLADRTACEIDYSQPWFVHHPIKSRLLWIHYFTKSCWVVGFQWWQIVCCPRRICGTVRSGPVIMIRM